MNNETVSGMNFPAPVPAEARSGGKPPKRRKMPRWVAGVILSGVVGIALGNASAGAVEPERIEVPVEVPVEVEVEKIIETTPSVCIAALDDAEAVVSLGAEALGYSGAAIEAAGSFDISGLEAANADLEGLAPKMTDAVAEYNSSALACRASN